MSTVQRIAKNTIALSIAELVAMIINFFLFMYVARYLGARGFGVLSFALALTAIFGVFTDIGLKTLTIREVARDRTRAKKYLGNIAVLKTVLGIAAFGLIALSVNLLGYPEETIHVVFLIALSVIIGSFNQMFESIFQAYERMEFITIEQVLGAVLRLGGALFVIKQGLSVTALAFVFLLAGVVTLGFDSIISTWKFAKPRIEVDIAFWKDTLKQAWPFALVAVFVSIYYWVDSVMLSIMQGDEVVGLYNAAYRLVLAFGLISGSYSSAIFPVMSKFYVSSKESLEFVYEKSVKYMLILAVPICLGTTLLADKVVRLIYGAEYSSSTIALQILVWSMLFVFVSSVIAQLLFSLNRQIIVTKVAGSCTLLNVILNLVLIPRYSYIGASIATVITEFVALAIVFVWSRKIGQAGSGKKFAVIIAKVLIASAITIMGVFIFYLRGLALWWLVLLSALLYFVVLYIIRGIDKEDILLLRQMARSDKLSSR